MKIKFLGAARTVTGSCYMVEANGHRFAVDCGMHQGNAEIEKRNWDMEAYEPAEIEFCVITHAHIDHTGLLPRLAKSGFKGPVYTTPPTKDLLEILLLDSAHIQEMEAFWRNQRHARHGGKQVEALYTRKDAEAALRQIQAVLYNESLSPFPGLEITFRDAGHILGASMVEIVVQENGTKSKLLFSGDIGRPSQLLVEDPTIESGADFLFMESTYGDRDHKNETASLNELAEAIAYSYKNKEKVIIPAFALERSQEIIYSLYMLSKDGRLPSNMPVYLDSPLAIKATEIFRRHMDYLDEKTQALLDKGENPLNLPQLHFTQTTEESRAINNTPGAAIVISASGMAHAGRIKHHLRHNLWRPGASVIFVGFQAQGTTGRKIVDGANKVRIFQEEIAVKAKIFTINGFSAHAGQSQLLDWLSHFKNPHMQIFLIHGERDTQKLFAEKIREHFNFQIFIPDYLEEVTLKPGYELERVKHPEKATPRINWDFILADLEAKFARLQERKPALEAKAWVEQTDIRDKILELNRNLLETISEI
ncbi:MAG: MBL fold metallo-hydrolase [Syntrophales bacterium]